MYSSDMELHDANGASKEPSWEELLGSNHWKGLIDSDNYTVDNTLRDLLLQCGDMCQVTVDSFNSEETSKYQGYCRYSRRDLFHKVFFPKAVNYDVHFYLYAVSQHQQTEDKDSNWMGYIAVSNDAHVAATGRREIYVVWRGTSTKRPYELHEDVCNTGPVDFDHAEPGVQVMGGWHDFYTLTDHPKTPKSAQEQLKAYIRKLVDEHAEESLSIICTGHSLGGTLAIMSAFDLVKSGFSKVRNKEEYFPVCAVVFQSPKVGNEAFKAKMEKLPNLRVLSVKNQGDLALKWPLDDSFVENGGERLEVDSDKSPYLKKGINPKLKHRLQVVLHTVAGWNGEEGEFQWPPPTSEKRSLAAVNKNGSSLKEEIMIPVKWWVAENMGMVLGEDGEWHETPPEDYPINS